MIHICVSFAFTIADGWWGVSSDEYNMNIKQIGFDFIGFILIPFWKKNKWILGHNFCEIVKII